MRSDFSSGDTNCVIISWYTSPVIVDVKKIGLTILFLDIPHHTPVLGDAELTRAIHADTFNRAI